MQYHDIYGTDPINLPYTILWPDVKLTIGDNTSLIVGPHIADGDGELGINFQENKQVTYSDREA